MPKSVATPGMQSSRRWAPDAGGISVSHAWDRDTIHLAVTFRLYMATVARPATSRPKKQPEISGPRIIHLGPRSAGVVLVSWRRSDDGQWSHALTLLRPKFASAAVLFVPQPTQTYGLLSNSGPSHSGYAADAADRRYEVLQIWSSTR